MYQPDETMQLEVRIIQDTVWLNREQMARLFGRDIKTIGKHINNALMEELGPTGAKNATVQLNPVVAKFATTASNGKTYQIEYFSLDVVISVGYRVHSTQGIIFRAWANGVLKDHLLRGYSVNKQLVSMQERTDERFQQIEQRLDAQQEKVDFLVMTHTQHDEKLLPGGCVFDAWAYVSNLVRKAEKRIVLIDNYCDDRTLSLLTKRSDGVEAVIHSRYSAAFEQDLKKHGAQYPKVGFVQLPHREHDSFLIIDDTVYMLGDSVKNLGHSLTAVLKTGFTPEEILKRVK